MKDYSLCLDSIAILHSNNSLSVTLSVLWMFIHVPITCFDLYVHKFTVLVMYMCAAYLAWL